MHKRPCASRTILTGIYFCQDILKILTLSQMSFVSRLGYHFFTCVILSSHWVLYLIGGSCGDASVGLKTRVSGFLIILRNTTNDDSVILNSGFYFYGITLKAHYSITLKILRFQVIGFCFLWISIALFLVQSPVARGFELHGYWVLCESRRRQNSLSHEDE